jgi:hypothetical protein
MRGILDTVCQFNLDNATDASWPDNRRWRFWAIERQRSHDRIFDDNRIVWNFNRARGRLRGGR